MPLDARMAEPVVAAPPVAPVAPRPSAGCPMDDPFALPPLVLRIGRPGGGMEEEAGPRGGFAGLAGAALLLFAAGIAAGVMLLE